jgi:hypothetical protein
LRGTLAALGGTHGTTNGVSWCFVMQGS